MQLVFLRHGESEFNVINEPKTSVDCPLTPFGRLQSSLLIGHFDLVIVSPLLRARQTLDCSQITYKHREEWYVVREQILDSSDCLQGEKMLDTIESVELLTDRVDLFLEQVKLYGVERVLIVSHNEFIAQLVGHGVENASLHELKLI